jgi:hypothetical protein
MIGENGDAYKTLVAKSIGKGLLGKPRRDSKVTFKIGLREIYPDNGKWKEVSGDRVQWQALILMAVDLRLVLPESCLLGNKLDMDYKPLDHANTFVTKVNMNKLVLTTLASVSLLPRPSPLPTAVHSRR